MGAETVTAVSFFVNDIDLAAAAPFDFAGGHGQATLAWNVTDTKIREPGATLTAAGVRELEDGSGELRRPVARLRARDWGAVLRLRHYGKVYEHLLNCESCAIESGAMTLVDAELTRTLARRYALTLGVRNLNDRKPDRHRFAGVPGFLGADYPLSHSRRSQRRRLLPATQGRTIGESARSYDRNVLERHFIVLVFHQDRPYFVSLQTIDALDHRKRTAATRALAQCR